ncbi:Virulence-regulating protein VirS [Variovorax sp. SRS16]|uniref:AraC family transcriptional regulator n=1 Tax=Variovorax sp. SRS16 TaxID=282217 RepID=UPI0013197384|nr:AraC family transcriptional regulator [Variovorax sp. SRS16]VTU25672.1 Virulence-regulating protein VirS [Variovorax sp. SRS16]
MQRATPSFEHRIYPAHKIAALVGVLVDKGVPAAEVLAGSGLAESRLNAAATRVSYRQMLTVCRNAMRLSPDPAVALQAGQRMHVTAYGMYGYALLSSPTHADSVDFAVKHHRVMGPAADMSVRQSDDEVIFSYRPVLAPDPTNAFYRFVTEFQLSSHLTITTDLYGAAFRFSQVRLSYPAPPHAPAYRKVFKCPVHFGQPVDELRFNSDWLAEPMPFADPITNAMAREMCEKSLAEVDQAGGIAAEIRRILVGQPGRFPGIEAMAEALRLNPRTLRRKLDAEETSYRSILADVRMRLAIGYLRETRMTNEEIASRLGYSDAANFRHALSRWTRKNPSDFRASHTGENLP